jgi:hypothetical protein
MARMRVVKEKIGKSREIPCKFLGEPTGTLRKKGCRNRPDMIEHNCLHVGRSIILKRANKVVNGKCTPIGICHEFRSGIDIQPCYKCPLYEAPP